MYAASGGKAFAYGSLGQAISSQQANFGCIVGHTVNVDAQPYQPNDFGLCQMLGNCWEWVETPWRDTKRGVDLGSLIIKGGSWWEPASNLTITSRRNLPAYVRSDTVGFRVVCHLQQGLLVDV
jgi:formylglycine-generating enzyme required for sulfatase activity